MKAEEEIYNILKHHKIVLKKREELLKNLIEWLEGEIKWRYEESIENWDAAKLKALEEILTKLN